MQSLQIHDLFQLLGPNSKPLLDQIEELKKLRSEYEQTIEQAREKERSIKELHRSNYGVLEAIQYENNTRQQELEDMKQSLNLRAANEKQRELQLQERIKQVELKEAQLKQYEAQTIQKLNEASRRESEVHQREVFLSHQIQTNQKIIDQLKDYVCQLT